jgi:ATP-dependent DNA helicase RecQ
VSKRISDNFPKEDFIRNVYEKLGYYHQMAVGDGRGCTYAFSLGEFCQHYMLPILPTDSSLRILTRMGYIEYLDEMDYSARLLFTAGRDDLYRLHHDKTTEEVMNIILRNYSGVFTDYAYIDEHMICSMAGIDRDMLYTILMSLQSQGVIRYVPERRTPVITWTRERIDTQLIRFDPEVYRQRKEEFKERIGAMMEYVTRETGCRSAILLKYFGEHQSKPCLCCDLCQEKVQGDLSRGERETIMEDILDTFHSCPDNPQKVYTLPYDRKKIDIVLHYMVNEGHILMKDGKIITKND